MEPIRAARVVLVATGEGVGHLSGTTYLASFGASTLLHGTKLQVSARSPGEGGGGGIG